MNGSRFSLKRFYNDEEGVEPVFNCEKLYSMRWFQTTVSFVRQNKLMLLIITLVTLVITISLVHFTHRNSDHVNSEDSTDFEGIFDIGPEISQPRALLYSEPNGFVETYNPKGLLDPYSCMNLNLNHSIKSIDTLGTCVRLYNSTNCFQDSVAFYPLQEQSSESQVSTKQWSILERNRMMPLARSIGPCMDNELTGSHFKENKDGLKMFNKSVSPDIDPPILIIPDRIFLGSAGLHHHLNTHPICTYFSGKNERVLLVEAEIFFSNIKTHWINTMSGDEHDSWLKMVRKDGDEVGRFIGMQLGAQEVPFNNLYPQSPQHHQLMMAREKVIVDYLNENQNKYVYVTINVDYESTNRPTGLSYSIEFNRESRSVVYLTNVM